MINFYNQPTCLKDIKLCYFVVEVKIEEKKHFFDLLTIPGCFVMLMHCAAMKFLISSVDVSVSDWITTQVNTYITLNVFILGFKPQQCFINYIH